MWRINSLLGAAFNGWAALGGFTKLSLCTLAVSAGAAINSDVVSKSLRPDLFWLDKDKTAPVDYGFGPGAGKGPARPNLVLGQTPAIPRSMRVAPNTVPGTVPIGGGAGGFFGPSFPWPIIPIHMELLPDGRVLNYGTNEMGVQAAQILYDIWDPRLGNGSNAQTILPNGTWDNIFCSAGSLIGEGPAVPTSLTGNVLISGGGGQVVDSKVDFPNSNVDVFSPWNNTLTASGTMNNPRYYPSMTSLRNGDKLVLGGWKAPGVVTPEPEVYHPGSGWRTLTGITITDWYYPRGFLGPDGGVTLLHSYGQIFKITTGGSGTMTDTGSRMAVSGPNYPSAMFAPFKVLRIGNGVTAQVIDFSSSPPVVTGVANLSYDRIWGNATVLPDGEVLVTGGSSVSNELPNVAYPAEIFNPASGTWTLGACPAACAKIPRLYHSAALLLPDGSVLTGGGGAPGPVNELNAEIYYPAYLYLNDGSGNPAPRPTIVAAPTRLILGQKFTMTVGSSDQIAYVDLVRVGASTHTFNPEQRLIPVPFTQSGTTVQGSVNSAPEIIPPGYYMLFVFNTNGVPAVAKIISVPQSVLQ